MADPTARRRGWKEVVSDAGRSEVEERLRSYVHLSDHEEDTVAKLREPADDADQQPRPDRIGEEKREHKRGGRKSGVVVDRSHQSVMGATPVQPEASADDK